MNTRIELERVLQEQAEKLGGGWRIEHGVMPVIILTTAEAEKLIKKLEQG